MWHWRRSFQCWVFALSEGKLVFLTNESLVILSCFIHAVSSQVYNTLYLDYVGLHKYVSCVIPTENPFKIMQDNDTSLSSRHISPISLSTMLAALGNGRQCLLISYLALKITQELLLMYKTLHCISFSGTDKPEWMSNFSETLLQPYMGSCCYCHLGYNSPWCYKLLSHSVVFLYP